MRVFFDTNVLLDTHMPDREGHAIALELAGLVQEERIFPFCAMHSLSIIEYVLRKTYDKEVILAIIQGVLRTYTIPAVDDREALSAFSFVETDYEDALQIGYAVLGGCDRILTNDKRGFAQSPIPVMSPREFLEESGSEQIGYEKVNKTGAGSLKSLPI